ncbi:MAG: SCP2 sterol-binding domain-containing protein [Jatrophihabitans sp.]|uniref:SCP2 sterol-binding domain-containing protein n=1 Tax=Jatrophihabitans sp. TaxID=1932789 RepID=UPI003F7D92CC
MATLEQCEQALDALAARLAAREPSASRRSLDRSLVCVLPDLDVAFGGRLFEGRLDDIRRLPAGAPPQAQVRLTMASDDLLRLVDGQLNMAAAWATGRVKVDAGIRDVMKLRSFF